MGDLCTLQDIQLYLLETFGDNPSGDDEAGRINYLISAVSNEIESICNRKFNADDYDEVFDLDGREVQLRQYPINSITTVEWGTPFGTVDRTELETTEYLRYNDIGVLRLNLTLRRADQYVRVVYNAGFETIPADLNLITVKEVVRSLKGTDQDTNLKSEKTGDESYTYYSSAENDENLRKILVDYINYNK